MSTEPSAGGLTLSRAQSLALEHNPDLRSALAQLEIARGQVRSAREWSNPTLSLSTSKIATDGSGNGTSRGNGFLDRSYDSIASLSQLIELGGKRGLRQQSARAGELTAQAQQEDVRRLLVQSVTQAYIAALEAREEARVLTESAGALRHEAEIAGRRFSSGDISQSDQAQIEIAARRTELDAAAANQNARAAVVTLEILLGQAHPEGRTELVDTLDGLPLPTATLLMQSGPVRPDVAAAEAAASKAEFDLEAQKRMAVPDPTISVQYERNPPDQANTAGLGISFPLPIWNRNGGAIHSARAARDQAQIALEKTRLQAAADIANARLAYEEARSRLEAYAKELKPKSAHVAETVTYAYEHGSASLTEILEAQRSDNEVRLAHTRAQADLASAAVALATALNRSDALLSAPGKPL